MSAAVLTMRILTEDAFVERFGPRLNHLDFTAGLDWGHGGCLFAATGKQFKYVLAQNPHTVWTLLEGDDDQLVIESGMRVAGRLGYLVTTQPREDNASYSVLLD